MARTGPERPRSGAEGGVEPARPCPALDLKISRRVFFRGMAPLFRAPEVWDGAVVPHDVLFSQKEPKTFCCFGRFKTGSVVSAAGRRMLNCR